MGAGVGAIVVVIGMIYLVVKGIDWVNTTIRNWRKKK